VNTRHHSADTSVLTTILTLVAVALLTVSTGLWVMLQLEQLAPALGGIVVFQPGTAASERWSVAVDIAQPAGDRPTANTGVHCALSPNVMGIGGGSLVIEARRMSRPPVFRVHWAGGHTANGSSDCGTAADVVIERTELMRLANAAGGLNGGLGLIGP
jgi:hypothetical protein